MLLFSISIDCNVWKCALNGIVGVGAKMLNRFCKEEQWISWFRRLLPIECKSTSVIKGFYEIFSNDYDIRLSTIF